MTALLKITYKAGALLMAACAGLIVCSSCTDEEFMKGSGKTDKLSFGVSISDKWNAGPTTRSTENNGPKYEAYKFDNSDMWIIASEEEGIENATFPEKKMETRGMPVTNAKELSNVHEAFGVYAYHSDDETLSQPAPYIINEKVSGLSANGQNTVQQWIAQSQHFWPTTGYMKFYAFSPSSISGQIKPENNTLTLDYTVPETSTEQPDILLALPQDPANKLAYTCSEHENVGLTFRHALTAVKVRAAEGVEGTISRVTISGVRNKGTITFDGIQFTQDNQDKHAGIDQNNWTNLTQSTGFPGFTAQLNNKEITGSDETSGESYTNSFMVDNEFTFMMLPQQLSNNENATLTVLFSDGRTLSGKIGGTGRTDWKMGHTVVYNISNTQILEERVFEATPEKFEVSVWGGNISYTIKSYLEKKQTSGTDNAITPLPWTLDEEQSILFDEWKTSIKKSGNGGNTGENFTLNVSPNNGYDVWNSDLNASAWNSQGYILSYPIPKGQNDQQHLHKNECNTANCYMISHQGFHYLPLVYGNGIRNGVENEQAYKDGNDWFVDGAGKKIKTPYIEKNYEINKLKVKLLWTDAKGMIIQQELNNKFEPKEIAGKKVNCIKFKYETNAIKNNSIQGNALIGLTTMIEGKEKIIWSWHIWVTGYQGFTIHDPTSGYDFMLYNLGWCGSMLKGPREAKLVFKQEYNNKTLYRTIIVKQAGVISAVESDKAQKAGGHGVFYQWGRKDPIPGVIDYWKGQHGDELIKDNKTIPGPLSLQEASNHADKFITNDGYWLNDNIPNSPKYNLWNNASQKVVSKGEEEQTIKTVYDPCPPGFMVPPQYACPQSNDNELVGGFNTGGWYIANRAILFPVTGRLQYSSGQREVAADKSEHGFYWTSSMFKGNIPWMYYEGDVVTSEASGYGLAIRPVREPGINPPPMGGTIEVNPWGDNGEKDIEVHE